MRYKKYVLIYSTLEFSHTCTQLLPSYWWLSHPKKGLQVRFHPPVLVAGGASAPVASAQTYMRLLGRHALPHVYHSEDFHKLMRASRRASMVLRYTRLPAHYLLLMYWASARGSHWWFGGIRPPSYKVMKTADFPAASAVRSMDGHAGSSFHATYSVWLDRLSSHDSFHASSLYVELHETAVPCQPHSSLFYHKEFMEGISSLLLSDALCSVSLSRNVPGSQHWS